jgi:hypothetical protein
MYNPVNIHNTTLNDGISEDKKHLNAFYLSLENNHIK